MGGSEGWEGRMHQNPDTGGKRRAEKMAQARMDASCGFNLLDTGHEVVKKKPKAAAARDSVIRSNVEFIFLCHRGRLCSSTGTQSGSCSTH